MRTFILVSVLVTWVAPSWATVITTGDVDPGGAGTQPDPWAVVGTLSVGRTADGTLNVETGGEVSDTVGTIGYGYGVTGIATVHGAGSKWTSSDDLHVGYVGNGILNVEAEGEVFNGMGWIGYNSTGTATISGAGSTWTNSKQLTVGVLGKGTLNVEAGGEVYNTWGVIGLHSSPTSTRWGIATVTGTGSTWTNSDYLAVGELGRGTLNVAAGGSVFNTAAYIGYKSGSTGEATVTGAGSTWTSSDSLTIGGTSMSEGGSGTLNLQDSGEVAVTDTVKLWSSGTINFAGGSLATRSLDNSQAGTLNFADGTLTVSGAGGSFNPGTTNFVMDGNAPTDLPELVIADTAGAALAGNVTVGSSHRAKLAVDSGGQLSNTMAILGDDSGSTGIATVSGAGSKWTNTDDLVVGNSGNGTLNVEETGEVFNTVGYVGWASGSTGMVTVSGAGSKWTNSGWLHLGVYGGGTLQLEQGGEVANSVGRIGFEPGSTGVATVSGAGSKWTNTYWLAVGDYGNGTLEIEAGGEVFNTFGRVAYEPGSTGMVTVTGAGSKWINWISLYIGGRSTLAGGSGTLNIVDSGLVRVADTTRLWEEGLVNLDGGTLNTGTLDLTAGTFNMLDGLLRVDSVIGDITVQGGTLAPGHGYLWHSPAVLSMTGDYTQAAAATLEVELAGTDSGEFDQLTIAGTASLDGALDLLPLAPYADPTARGTTDNFVIIAAAARHGNFSTVHYNGLALATGSGTSGSGSFHHHQADGLFRSVIYTATAVQFQNLLAMPGDTDGDQDIDLGDYTRLATNFAPGGTGLGWTDGDFDSDGDIDLSDYNSLASNFRPLGYGVAAVPEPAAALLAVLAMLLVSSSDRRSKWRRGTRR